MKVQPVIKVIQAGGIRHREWKIVKNYATDFTDFHRVKQREKLVKIQSTLFKLVDVPFHSLSLLVLTSSQIKTVLFDRPIFFCPQSPGFGQPVGNSVGGAGNIIIRDIQFQHR